MSTADAPPQGRTLTMHNPTLYQAQAVGKRLLRDEPLPINGYF